jgi:hypothetical protein
MSEEEWKLYLTPTVFLALRAAAIKWDQDYHEGPWSLHFAGGGSLSIKDFGKNLAFGWVYDDKVDVIASITGLQKSEILSMNELLRPPAYAPPS